MWYLNKKPRNKNDKMWFCQEFRKLLLPVKKKSSMQRLVKTVCSPCFRFNRFETDMNVLIISAKKQKKKKVLYMLPAHATSSYPEIIHSQYDQSIIKTQPYRTHLSRHCSCYKKQDMKQNVSAQKEQMNPRWIYMFKIQRCFYCSLPTNNSSINDGMCQPILRARDK